MLPDGRLPENPWEGLGAEGRELCWALGCRGILIQRTCWCGYILLVPPGTGERFLPSLQAMATVVLAPDTGFWTEAMELRSNGQSRPAILHLGRHVEYDEQTPILPLRVSGWLEGDEDTLVVPGPWKNDVFVLLEHSGSGIHYSADDLPLGFWRGVSTEVVLSAAGRTGQALITSTVSGTPSDISQLRAMAFSQADSVLAGEFARVLATLDSLVTARYPMSVGLTGKLLWVRGMGFGEHISPWVSHPLPAPGEHSPLTVEAPEVLDSGFPTISPLLPPEVPGRLLGSTSTGGLHGDSELVLASILERLVANSLPGLGCSGLGVIVVPLGDSLSVYVTGGPEEIPVDLTLESVLARLRPTILLPPSDNLVHNASVRASVHAGRPVFTPDSHDLVMALASIVGLE
jgi:hypothetical protein